MQSRSFDFLRSKQLLLRFTWTKTLSVFMSSGVEEKHLVCAAYALSTECDVAAGAAAGPAPLKAAFPSVV